MKRTLLPLLIIAMAVSTANAAVYRWVDENGKVHYSDRPKSGKNAQVVDLNSSTIETSTNLHSNKDSSDMTTEETNQLSKEQIEYKKRACENARKRKATLDSGIRQMEVTSDGSPRIWDEADYARERKEVNKLIKQYCK